MKTSLSALALGSVLELTACGSKPELSPAERWAQDQARLEQESAARAVVIKAAVAACTNPFPSKIAVCKTLPDSAAPYVPETGRDQCKVDARTALVSCLIKAGQPAIDAGDLSNCAAIGTANAVCKMAFPVTNSTDIEYCEGDINDALRTCTGERSAPLAE